ncbi:GH36-type glycosyl hydrolase domain-containing protein [Puniceicoccus vermicola]|uniref:Glycosyl transferase family 36 n=1 Tax=Puniceicoccus vermicola TaxID=388746 RepID=A0A7X1AUU1_9BACT|nr:hypothetical protein [Puniceicoccus vermicola]MBC2600421.1 hypothetical protein [Puniceicoccus vermicola]
MLQVAEESRSETARNPRIPVKPWGYFNVSANEFVLDTPHTPRPWKNILWNETYNAQPTQLSGGISYKRYEDGTILLLNWSGHKYFYLKNLETGETFSPSIAPLSNKGFEAYEHTTGLSYSTTKITQCGLEVSVVHSVDSTLPREYFELSLKNLRDTAQPWRLVFFCDINLRCVDNKFGSADRFEGEVLSDHRRIITRNLSDPRNDHAAFLEASVPFDGYAFETEDFTGLTGSLARPDAVLEEWPTHLNPVQAPILAAHIDCTIPAGESEKSFFTLGLPDAQGYDLSTMELTTREQIQQSKDQQESRFTSTYESLNLQTPNTEFDLFVNTWFKHQLHYCAFWNRGWEKGFRDSNQDAWAFALLKPERSRQMILDCLPYQYADGRTVRKWGPVDRDAYNDGGTWLIFASHAYLAETGDFDLLQMESPFFESEDRGTCYEHLRRCVDYLWNNRGDKGLCLMPYGDWNDRLTGPGKEGKGQSVWTTMALAESLRKMVEIAEQCGYQEDALEYKTKREEITETLRREAWNGEWYSRAFNDFGKPVGAPENSEGSIYLLPQAWSIIAGIATPDQFPSLIEAVESKLQTTHGFRLLTPPYRQFDPSIGHLSATQPGYLENGGNYCHGTMFMTYALSLADQREKSLEALMSTLPINPDNPPSISRQEPYSITNSYAAPESGKMSGRSYFSWRTGAAGWALRCAVEGIMGVTATMKGLEIADALPVADWDSASVVRHYRGRKVRIQWKRTGTASRTLNGVECESGPLTTKDLWEAENQLEITF